MSEGFDPFAPAEGTTRFTGRPFRASRAVLCEAEGDVPEGKGRTPGTGWARGTGGEKEPAGVAERLLDLEDRLALVEAGLAQLDRKVGARLDEQMARIVLAVTELLNQRNGRPAEPKPKRWPKIDW